MYQIKIKDLALDSEFEYQNQRYVLEGTVWHCDPLTKQGGSYMGEQGDGIIVRNANPFAGNRFQKAIEVWFNEETFVTIS